MSYRQFSSALNKARCFFEVLLTSLKDVLLTQNVLVFSLFIALVYTVAFVFKFSFLRGVMVSTNGLLFNCNMLMANLSVTECVSDYIETQLPLPI